MSYNAWETTSPTSLHPITHFLCNAVMLPLSPYNDVGDVVSQALLLLVQNTYGIIYKM